MQDDIRSSKARTAGKMQHQILSLSEPQSFQRVPKVTRAQPFHLYSVIRHNLKMQELNRLQQKEMQEEARARIFNARPFSAVTQRCQVCLHT